jgi:hypothetical protein
MIISHVDSTFAEKTSPAVVQRTLLQWNPYKGELLWKKNSWSSKYFVNLI